jgi:uncharacterized membrane protein
MPRKVVLLFAALLMLASLSLAQGTYARFDYPGSDNTSAQGIDTAGDIVGHYGDTSSLYHGFLLSGGTYTTIDYPGAEFTVANGINDLGEVVGWAQIGETIFGFLYNIQTQSFTRISIPGADFPLTELFAINNAGQVVGVVEEVQGSNINYLGFVSKDGKYREILPTGFTDCNVTGINNAGIVVGYASTPGYLNFLQNGSGDVLPLTIPLTYPQVRGLNDSDVLVGLDQPSSDIIQGFLFQDGNVQSLVYPGATETVPAAINNARTVVGSFADINNVSHGFIWTPPAPKKQN